MSGGTVLGIYRKACVNCGGEVDDYRLYNGLPCRRCIPYEEIDITTPHIDEDIIYSYLKDRGLLKGYRYIYSIRKELRELEGFFHKATGSRLWSAQRTWSIRVFKGDSFSIVSPTGTGKTLFGVIMAIFLTRKKGKRAYIVVPTTQLVQHVYERITDIINSIGINRKILYYHTGMSRKDKHSFTKKLSDGEFDILITTSTFLSRKFELLDGLTMDFLFVDDVDAVLKSSKNIDRLLLLMGYSPATVMKALDVIRLKRRLARTKDEKEKNRMIMEINRLNKSIAKEKKKLRSVLIVSSATGRPKGLRVRLFRELLDFEVGTRTESIRNIIDTYLYIRGDMAEAAYNLIKKLGRGGLIFIPVDKGVKYADYLDEYLKSRGIRSAVLVSGRSGSLQKFINGDVDVLIGMAVYYGILVRGLDLPERVRYALFLGIPRFKFTTKFEDPNPSMILRALTLLYSVIEDEKKRREIEKYINRVRRLVLEASYQTLANIREKLLRGEPPRTFNEELVYNAFRFIRNELGDPVILDALKKHPEISVREEDDKVYLMIPDIMSYVQASGRTSRMYVGGLTRGLSIVLVDDEKLLRGLMKRSRWIIEDIEWRDFEDVDVKRVISEIDRDREQIRLLRLGKLDKEFRDPIRTILFVVESPNKARTISSFFGKPSIRRKGKYRVYEVSTGDKILIIAASGGHVYDIITDYRYEKRENIYGVLKSDGYFTPIYTSIKRCPRTGYQFTSDDPGDLNRYCPDGNIIDKFDIVRFLQDIAVEVDKVIIGTDPDSEGEKIGWDIAVLLRPYTKHIDRIEFHEVTKKAILTALDNPREFNRNLIEAQLVRRIEDRWIGFALSEWLTREMDSDRALSAGRVQTPVLGWIIERWREWGNPENKRRFYSITLENGVKLDYTEDEIPSRYSSPELLKNIKLSILEKEDLFEASNPPPPYITATMIEDATAVLNIGADSIMKIAQELFEMGLITYHRTDSTRVSSYGQYLAKEYIENMWPDEADKLYVGRSWGEGGAHECIRPTRPVDTDTIWNMIMEGSMVTIRPFTKIHARLYDLIFKRFIASQMAPAKIRRQRLLLEFDGSRREVVFTTEVDFEGFLRLYPGYIKKYDSVNTDIIGVKDVYTYVKPMKPLYKQSDLIRLMRERGIGRPSTYSKIIEVLLRRGYVIETKKNKYLYPTKGGIRVYNILKEYFGEMVSEETTRELEKIMDAIERGTAGYQEFLSELYREIIRINI